MQPETSKEADVKEASVEALALWPQVLVLALAAALCYANSLPVPFLFDDPFLNAPAARLDYSTRPLVSLSWDLNRALGGMHTWSYHVFNALVHLGCACLLLGVLRRSMALLAPQLAARTRDALAFVTALVWLCHPLQTAAVTYLSQRAETMGSFFYLAVLYAFLRSVACARPSGWQALALLSLALGFATKEIVATAPLVLWLLDAFFLAPGALAALRLRRGFHCALALVTLALALVYVVPLLQAEGVTVGFGLQEFGALEYARTQPGVLLHYLRLAFWPHPLCFDYGWPIARAPSDWVPQTLVVAALLLFLAVLLLRRSWVGFAGAYCVAVLAPTSSFIPITDLAFEHRFYLPLAAVLLLAVAGAWWFVRRFLPHTRHLLPGLGTSAALALAALTIYRNEDYRSAVRLMERTAECAPHNARAHANLGAALLDAGRPQEVIAPLMKSLSIDPHAGLTYLNLGMAYQRLDQLDRAIPFFRRAVEQIEDPRCCAALGEALFLKGDHAGAAQQFESALQLDPYRAAVHSRLAQTLVVLERREEAIQHYREALRLEPGLPQAQVELAVLLQQVGQ